MAHRTGHEVAKDLDQCIQECTACHRICLSTVQHSLEKGRRHAAEEHLGLLLDCAEICQTSANFMVRGSVLHVQVCGLCAEVCVRCAESCESIDDPFMAQCAEACRRCAESCEQMAA